MGIEHRRSPRIMLKVPLRVEATGSACNGHTAIVNRHGALVLCPLPCSQGTPIDVWNLETGERAPFEVVWAGGEDLPGLYKLGIELQEDRPTFWGSEYEDEVRLKTNAG
jgi:hypothetical protein